MMKPCLAGVAAAACLSGVVGCSDDTGILLRITRDPEASQLADLPRVELYVGVTADLAPELDTFVGDRHGDPAIATPSGDLNDNPYTVMLEPTDSMPDGASLFVIAIGTDATGEELRAVGSIEDENGDPRTVAFASDTVVIWDVVLRPLESEWVDVSDLGCVRWDTADGSWTVLSPDDLDCDDFANDVDCAPEDPGRNPGATEDCGSDLDEDCDGDGHNVTDHDGDGVTNCAGDCRDRDPNTYPGAAERCDGADNDCNPETPCDPDQDGDGFSTCGTVRFDQANGKYICQQVEYDGCALGELCDCAEGNQARNPGAAEVCDGVDNDCNASCDPDPDDDGYTTCGTIRWEGETSTCSVTVSEGGTCDVGTVLACDCAEDDPTAGGAVPERCDGLDNGCDGAHYPALSPCFVLDPLDPTSCRYGQRACDDFEPSNGWGQCQPVGDNGGALPPVTACTAYQACDDAADPYACALEGAIAYNCHQRATAGLAVCTPSAFSLPNPLNGTVGCVWSVLGGVAQGPWNVGLVATATPGDAPAADVAVCDATFVVTGLGATADGPQSIVLVQRVGGAAVLVEIQLSATLGDCDGEPLTCTAIGG